MNIQDFAPWKDCCLKLKTLKTDDYNTHDIKKNWKKHQFWPKEMHFHQTVKVGIEAQNEEVHIKTRNQSKFETTTMPNVSSMEVEGHDASNKLPTLEELMAIRVHHLIFNTKIYKN